MPYENQKAGKGGHIDIVKNPDISRFLEACDTLRAPTDEEGAEIAASYGAAPVGKDLPENVVASDGSVYAAPISGKFPSTQVGYVKLSFVIVNMASYAALTSPDSDYVDPFKAAALHRSGESITFTLPGSNVRYMGAATVQDGFRRVVWEQLSDPRTNFAKNGAYSAADTLFAIAGGELRVKYCPSCGFAPDTPFTFSPNRPVCECPACQTPVYATDTLRIHEEISDFGSNVSPMTRFMNTAEHLALAGLVRMLAEQQPAALAKMAFILDGPLAVFGPSAWISVALMRLYHQIGQNLRALGLPPPVILGLPKEGVAMDHARAIAPFVGAGRYRAIDDQYRENFVSAGSSKSLNFGDETYYGQDFIFKTEKGNIFVVAVPYPFPNKHNKAAFAQAKVDASNYPDLGRAFDVVRHFEFDLYRSAVVPVALAHRHASISLLPGGKVLDLMSRTGLGLG